jgi:hypothetical protein
VTTFSKARGHKLMRPALVCLLLLACSAYAALTYALERVSERDFSAIADPGLRVGYCIVSNMALSEKYLLAETAVRAPDFRMSMAVVPYALDGTDTEQKRAAIRSLRERDVLRQRAQQFSVRLADSCGYRQMAWPPEVTPLDISLRWLRHDSAFSFFLTKLGAEPDAADRVYQELRGSQEALMWDRWQQGGSLESMAVLLRGAIPALGSEGAGGKAFPSNSTG